MNVLMFLGVIVIGVIVGVGSSLYTKKDDGPVEEMAEAVIENQIENVVGLPEGFEKGKIDLTPGSKEEQDA